MGRDITAAAIYTRLSQDRSGDGLGVARQEKLCRRLAVERGWPVAEVYCDRDISAFNGANRPAFARLLDDLRAGTRDALIAVDQDRLSRRLSELAGLLDELARAAIPIVLASGEIDTTSADGLLRAQILGSVAEHESRKKSERLVRQREQAALRGEPHGGRRPFGYDRSGREVIAAEAELVIEAADRFLAGESLPSICRDWQTRGIATSSGREGGWTTTSLRSLLAGPRLAGLRVHRGEVVGPAVWPAILDEDTHRRLVVALGDPRRVQRGRPPARLLTGLLVCGRCKARLTSSLRTDGARRWVCVASPGRPGCGRLAIHSERAETEVTDRVLAALDSPAFAARLTAPRRARRPVEDVGRVEEDLEQLAADHGAGRISRREWLAAREGLERRLVVARAAVERDTALRLVAPLLGDVRAVWGGMSLDRQRAVLAALVDRVVVSAATRGAVWDPDRIEVVWRS